MSLLEQDNIKKGRVDENVTEFDFEAGNNKKYQVEAIWDSVVYTNKLERGHLLGLYYLIVWKCYLEEESIWELASAMQHLRKLIGSFNKDHLDNPIATFLPINSASPIAKPTIKPARPIKRKQGQLARCANKQAKKN